MCLFFPICIIWIPCHLDLMWSGLGLYTLDMLYPSWERETCYWIRHDKGGCFSMSVLIKWCSHILYKRPTLDFIVVLISPWAQIEFYRFSVQYDFTKNYSFIYQWLHSPLLSPGLFFCLVINFTQTVGLLGRVISPSQGRYLHTGQHKCRMNAPTDIRISSGILTHDPSSRASEDSSCLRRRFHCDLHKELYGAENIYVFKARNLY
jgi:hypothetical protein